MTKVTKLIESLKSNFKGLRTTIGLDIGSHSIKLIGLKTLHKIKTSPAANSALAENVTTFTVTRGTAAANSLNEIKLVLYLSLTGGGAANLQTKVYPKNLAKDLNYKNLYQKWMEDRSP